MSFLDGLIALANLFSPPEVPEVVAPPTPSRFRCGVPDCADGVVAFSDDRWTVVDCGVHNASTRHESTEREEREQRVIRVQDNWRQHGSSPPPRR